MENISGHITFLLSRHDCVIVPGVGAFIATTRPACYNAATGRWLPPTRHIAFNAAVRSDDGLLAHSFSRRLRVDFEEARKELSLSTAALQTGMRLPGGCRIGDIGTLACTADGRILFTPAMPPGRRAALVGHTPVAARLLAAGQDPAAMQEAAGSAAIEAEKTPAAMIMVTGRHRRLSGYMGKIAAALVVAVIAMLSVILPADFTRGTQMASVVPVPTVAKAAPVTESTVPAPEEEIATPGAPTAPEKREAAFHLIIGTFKTDKSAEKYMASYRGTTEAKRMYKIRGTKVVRVAVDSAESKNALLTILGDPDFKAHHPQAWIWAKN